MLLHIHIKVYPFASAVCRCLGHLSCSENLTITLDSGSTTLALKKEFEVLREVPTSRQILLLPHAEFGKETFETAGYSRNKGIELKDDETFKDIVSGATFLLFITNN